jgi:hypothetical protein
LAKKQGLFGFTAQGLMDNHPMLRLCQKVGFDIEKTETYGMYEMKMIFMDR